MDGQSLSASLSLSLCVSFSVCLSLSIFLALCLSLSLSSEAPVLCVSLSLSVSLSVAVCLALYLSHLGYTTLWRSVPHGTVPNSAVGHSAMVAPRVRSCNTNVTLEWDRYSDQLGWTCWFPQATGLYAGPAFAMLRVRPLCLFPAIFGNLPPFLFYMGYFHVPGVFFHANGVNFPECCSN